MSKKLTTEEFIQRAKEVHGDKYDYSLVNYIKSSKKITIICKHHGRFEQRANNHLLGRGCYKCKKSKKYNTIKFIEMSNKIHNNIFSYNKCIYNNSHENVIITCYKHGDFKQSPTNHISGKGCPKCAIEKLRINDFFDRANIIHNYKYIYSDDFINVRCKIKIICKEHGAFKQRAKNHLDGQGCPKCGEQFGIKENKWLDEIGILKENRQIRIGRYIVDGYDSETNTIYEFNGDFWHGNPHIFDSNKINNVLGKTFGELYKKTKDREEYFIKKGYNLISIWENDFNKSQSIS